MPLLDHLHPPLHLTRHWESFLASWASALSDSLNGDLLPSGYFAEPHVRAGAAIEVDATIWDQHDLPAPTLTVPMAFIDTFEVQVYSPKGAMKLVGVIEIVSPANKDRPDTRRAFAVKCASLLNQGIGLLVVDIVTDRLGNLHDDIVRLLPNGESHLLLGSPVVYAAAYRPVRAETIEKAEVWIQPLAVGNALPVLPLWLSDGPCLRIDLEQDLHRRLPSLAAPAVSGRVP